MHAGDIKAGTADQAFQIIGKRQCRGAAEQRKDNQKRKGAMIQPTLEMQKQRCQKNDVECDLQIAQFDDFFVLFHNTPYFLNAYAKSEPCHRSKGIHNNFLGQTLIQPDFTALHHDEIITVKLRQNRNPGPGNKPQRLQIMALFFLAADFIDDVKLIEIG